MSSAAWPRVLPLCVHRDQARRPCLHDRNERHTSSATAHSTAAATAPVPGSQPPIQDEWGSFTWCALAARTHTAWPLRVSSTKRIAASGAPSAAAGGGRPGAWGEQTSAISRGEACGASRTTFADAAPATCLIGSPVGKAPERGAARHALPHAPCAVPRHPLPVAHAGLHRRHGLILCGDRRHRVRHHQRAPSHRRGARSADRCTHSAGDCGASSNSRSRKESSSTRCPEDITSGPTHIRGHARTHGAPAQAR